MMKLASSDARKAIAAAVSRGWPRRRRGIAAAMSRNLASLLAAPRSIAVSVSPGQTAFTRIPWCAWSAAMLRVSCTIAPLLVPYATACAAATKPQSEATLTMAPPSCCAMMDTAARDRRKTAVTLTAMVMSHCASVQVWEFLLE